MQISRPLSWLLRRLDAFRFWCVMALLISSRPGLEAPGPSTAGLDVVCIPDMDWNYPVWTNRQQVMSRLPVLDETVRVLYVSPPRWLVRRDDSGGRGRHRQVPTLARLLTVRRLSERLWVADCALPVPNRMLRRAWPGMYAAFIEAATEIARRRLGFTDPVLWLYDPTAGGIAKRIPHRLVCYDVVDDYPTLPFYRRIAPDVQARHISLLNDADIVFTTTSRIVEAYGAAGAHAVGNAADVNLFAQTRAEIDTAAELAAMRRPLIGFHGTLSSHKLDVDLVRDLAEAQPDWTFVLVGPVTDAAISDAIGRLDNVHLLGRRAPEQLPPILASLDAAFIPYRITDYTKGIDALKAYEYLAAGVPVVATALPCFQGRPDQIAVGRDTAEFKRLLAAIVSGAVPGAPLPLDELTGVSWDAKARRMLDIVRAALADTTPAAPSTPVVKVPA